MLSQIAPDEDLVFFRPHEYLARENEPPAGLYQMLEGWACRYRLLPDGRRQITALYLPGDYCEPQWALGRGPTQPVVALTNVRAYRSACRVPSGGSGDAQQGFWKNLVDGSERQAGWLVTLGRRSAPERLAHLLLELFERMRRAGLAYGQQCALPLTQMDIADLTGLTPVHVNRTLQTMRNAGLVELQSRWLRIPDLAALREAAAMAPQDAVA
ncbi:Crp/Fnr family transcriptional regulator [Sphingobium amiense]|uniref:Crp/Fnr family transcriptional regulator n=1 Tax=Sphingobium amiense TaxID=135719 RepID=A0A494WA92_9SPHN|nr:Crp/Fnr family transcriptional regulator [Sphingobium amiense]BBD99557.1 Crp/Fnr family transcriptional regulator [Sphingobium amiense]